MIKITEAIPRKHTVHMKNSIGKERGDFPSSN